MKFRGNLVHLRAVNNMTQEQLAMLLGVSRQSVAKWEAGKSYPEMDKLLSLCQIFDCTLDELVQGDLSAREAASPIAQVSGGAPTDVFGYDEQMRAFASKIANGVFAIIMGIAVSMVFFSAADAWEGMGSHAENVYAALGLLCMFVGIGAGLAFIIPASIDHSAFVKAHPYIQDFYTPEQRSEASRSFTRQLIGGLCCIFVGICVIMVFGDTRFEETVGLPAMLALIAIGVRFIISGAMALGRVNIDEYNKTAGEYLSPEDIEGSGLPDARKDQLYAAQKSDKRIGAVCGTIMLIATIAGLVMLFVPGYQTPLFWLVWPIGGLLCAVFATLMHGFGKGDAR